MDPAPQLEPAPWLSVLVRALGALEALLPALLVAWNGELRAKVAGAREGQALAEARLKGELDARKIGDETLGLGRRALLDRAIRRARREPGP